MKKLRLFFATILALVISTQISIAAVGKYNLEANHSSVMWIANHLGFSSVSGKFTDVSGVINFDEQDPKKSSVDVVIKTASIATGLPKFDQHLKSKDFFNTEQFPTAKFVSTKITTTSKNTAKIVGDLTLLGITKPITLNAKFNKVALHPMNNQPTIGFSATTTINRSDFGISYGIPAVADKVDLVIEIEANQ